jgi:hypothetical protein
MFRKRKEEDYLSEEDYLELREKHDMERYEKMFGDFYERINPIASRIDGFKIDPVNKPHNLSFKLQQEMELLHMKLSNALYRLRLGELQERLEIKEIDLQEYDELSKELFERDGPYTHI